MEQSKREKFGLRIGYRHLEGAIMNSQKTEAQKQAWRAFEDIRDDLYGVYITAARDNARFSNSDLESALREITCSEKNESAQDDIAQWRTVIERYCTAPKQEILKKNLLSILEAKQ